LSEVQKAIVKTLKKIKLEDLLWWTKIMRIIRNLRLFGIQ
jgi:hypothetical protein